MTDVRKEFEAFWAQEIAMNGGVAIGADYRHWALVAWQASRKAALEEAAKVCDRQSAKSDWHAGDEGVGCDKCADLIRALAAPAATGEEG